MEIPRSNLADIAAMLVTLVLTLLLIQLRNDMADSLRELQQTQGAIFPSASEADDLPALHFGDVAPEYRAARESCAVVDLTDRVQIEVTGVDRAAFLNNFCTNDINRLKVGEGCEAFVTSIKAKILAHLFVFAGESTHWIESSPGTTASLLGHLDRYIITEDVQLVDRSQAWGALSLIGPNAERIVGEQLNCVPPTTPWGHLSNDDGIAIRRTPCVDASQFEVIAPVEQLAELWRSFTSVGAVHCGRDAYEVLRLEASFPAYGVDLSDVNLAPEAGRNKEAISYTKGCYLGQEPIARIHAIGHVNRVLCLVRIDEC